MINDIENKVVRKPAKPYPEFPLFPHATGRWAKKIRGKMHYFGRWDDADGALQKYWDQRDDLFAGRVPRSSKDGLTIRDLVNHFLTAKQHQRDSGEIRARTFGDYHATCARVVESFGAHRLLEDLRSEDFNSLRNEIAKRRGPVSLGNEVQRVRVIFKYAYDAGLIEQPIRFGPHFKRPSKRVLREARMKSGPRMFNTEELHALLEAAGPQLKAMILLGINCGFGNNDCGTLPQSSLDLGRSWVHHPRPKTAIERRCPLWTETLTAIQAWLDHRPADLSDEVKDLVFVTKYRSKQSASNPISAEFRKLLQSTAIGEPAKSIYRKGIGFYTLRHTFETIAGESRDQIAVDYIMGHAPDVSAVYRERISDERLVAVTDFVHEWLFESCP